MKNIKSYNEAFNTNTLEDILIDITDEGYTWDLVNTTKSNGTSIVSIYINNTVEFDIKKIKETAQRILKYLESDGYKPSGNTEDIMYEIDNDIFDYENWVSGYSTWLYHTKKYGTTREIDPISLQLTFSK